MKHLIPLLVSATLAVEVGATDWPSWRGVDRNGITPETAWSHDWPADGPKQLWKANVGTGFSSMVVAAGRVFTMGWSADQDTVVSLMPSPGRPTDVPLCREARGQDV